MQGPVPEMAALPTLDTNALRAPVAFRATARSQFHLAEQDLGLALRQRKGINPLERGHIAFRTDDIAAFKRHLEAQGVPYADYGTTFTRYWHQVFFHDPAGTVIEVHQVLGEAGRPTLRWGRTMNSYDLGGRRAIVTGGAQGIGRAIVERFLDSGAPVTIWDMDRALWQRVCDELASRGTALRGRRRRLGLGARQLGRRPHHRRDGRRRDPGLQCRHRRRQRHASPTWTRPSGGASSIST